MRLATILVAALLGSATLVGGMSAPLANQKPAKSKRAAQRGNRSVPQAKSPQVEPGKGLRAKVGARSSQREALLAEHVRQSTEVRDAAVALLGFNGKTTKVHVRPVQAEEDCCRTSEALEGLYYADVYPQKGQRWLMLMERTRQGPRSISRMKMRRVESWRKRARAGAIPWRAAMADVLRSDAGRSQVVAFLGAAGAAAVLVVKAIWTQEVSVLESVGMSSLFSGATYFAKALFAARDRAEEDQLEAVGEGMEWYFENPTARFPAIYAVYEQALNPLLTARKLPLNEFQFLRIFRAAAIRGPGFSRRVFRRPGAEGTEAPPRARAAAFTETPQAAALGEASDDPPAASLEAPEVPALLSPVVFDGDRVEGAEEGGAGE